MQLEKLNKNLKNRDIVPVSLTFITFMLFFVWGIAGSVMHAESRTAGSQIENHR